MIESIVVSYFIAGLSIYCLAAATGGVFVEGEDKRPLPFKLVPISVHAFLYVIAFWPWVLLKNAEIV